MSVPLDLLRHRAGEGLIYIIYRTVMGVDISINEVCAGSALEF
jgi:hypothetical protein